MLVVIYFSHGIHLQTRESFIFTKNRTLETDQVLFSKKKKFKYLLSLETLLEETPFAWTVEGMCNQFYRVQLTGFFEQKIIFEFPFSFRLSKSVHSLGELHLLMFRIDVDVIAIAWAILAIHQLLMWSLWTRIYCHFQLRVTFYQFLYGKLQTWSNNGEINCIDCIWSAPLPGGHYQLNRFLSLYWSMIGILQLFSQPYLHFVVVNFDECQRMQCALNTMCITRYASYRCYVSVAWNAFIA